MNDIDLTQFSGETLIDVTGFSVDSDEVKFFFDDGTALRLYHVGDCCESVAVSHVYGSPSNFIGKKISSIQKEINPPWHEIDGEDYESFTVTAYTISFRRLTLKLRVIFLGVSNGYYWEGVDEAVLNGLKPLPKAVPKEEQSSAPQYDI